MTPPDQKPVKFTASNEDFEQLIICEEGIPNGGFDSEGNKIPRLHYHAYILSIRSRTWIEGWMKKHLQPPPDVKGNQLYSLKVGNDGTLGYTIKYGNVVFRLGCDQMFLDEAMKRSEAYRTEKAAERKRASRTKTNYLARVVEEVAEGGLITSQTTPLEVTQMILAKYHQNQVRFPTRSILETATMGLLYPYRQRDVNEWYAKNLSFY